MNTQISRSPAGGVIPAIPSKSAAHRIMIAAALSGLEPGESFDGLSEDITATKNCLEALGLWSSDDKEKGQKDTEKIRKLFCGESGSTLRFLIPLAAVLGIDADFYCAGRLPDRPMDPLIRCLNEHGTSLEGRDPKMVRGKLSGGEYTLAGNVSSQYVTGLLMALPLAEDDSTLRVEGRLQSRPYVDMTMEVLKKAGISILETARESGTDGAEDTVFEIRGRQKYALSREDRDHVEGDWSNAAFWMVMDAVSDGRIECTGLDSASAQGDRAIADLIPQMKKAGSDHFRIDVSDIPDLVPALSVLACGRPEGSVTEITGAERLRFKESDRLRAVSTVLTGLGADIEELEAGLLIRSRGPIRGGTADSFGDHRIVMMAAAAACISEGDVTVIGAEAVRKSYPRFFDDYNKLGGEAKWLQHSDR